MTSNPALIDDRAPSNEFTETFDYVIVFPMIANKDGSNEQSPVARFVMHQMLGAGLEIYPYLSVQDDELLVLFRCPLIVLQKFADQIDFKLAMDPAVLEETLLAGDVENKIAPIKINHDPSITPLTPFEHGEWCSFSYTVMFILYCYTMQCFSSMTKVLIRNFIMLEKENQAHSTNLYV